MTHTALFLGVDAGGTKTHAIIADADGNLCGQGRSGCGNWEAVGIDGAGAALAQAIHIALTQVGAQASDLRAAGYGLAGVDWPSDEQRLAPMIAALGVPGPSALVNDSYVALAAGAHDGCGVAVIAGTGSVVAGCNRHGERWRTFGVGGIWGDIGGASDLVALATRAVAYADYGRGPATALTASLLAACGVHTVPELVEQVSRGTIHAPGSQLAPLVTAAAQAGDAVACALAASIGSELGQNAATVARRLNMCAEPFDLVLAGSVLCSGCAPLVDALLHEVRAIAPLVTPVVLGVPPAAGGVVLAMQVAGTPISAVGRARLLAALVHAPTADRR